MGSAMYGRDLVRQALGQVDGSGRNVRDFRVLVAAKGGLDIVFRFHLQQVFRTPALWSLLPQSHLTEHMRCLIFRMASREGAEFERTIGHPTRTSLFVSDWPSNRLN